MVLQFGLTSDQSLHLVRVFEYVGITERLVYLFIFSMVGVSKMFPPHKQVLKDIYLSFFYGAKIGIIGLNGSGKSTLLKIIAGVEKSYQGEVVFSPGYSVGYLEQEPKLDPEKTVKEVVQEGVQPILDLLAEYLRPDRVRESTRPRGRGNNGRG